MFPPLALLVASRRRRTLSAKFRKRATAATPPVKHSRAQLQFLVGRRLTAVLISCHKFSIGFASGDFGGQSNSVTSCWCSHCLVDREVWIGGLSCWRTKSFVSVHVLLQNLLVRRAVQTTFQFHQRPHTITLAACWTVRSQHLGRNSSPLRRQTYRAQSFPMLTFDSSVKRTDFQSCKDHRVRVVAHPSRKRRLFSVSSGFF